MENDTEHDGINTIKKTASRKWRLVICILVISIVGTFAPPLLSLWLFNAETPLFILTGGEFVTLVTLIVSAYFGANVWQKHVLRNDPYGPYGGMQGPYGGMQNPYGGGLSGGVYDNSYGDPYNSHVGGQISSTTTTITNNPNETKIESNENGEA